LQQFSWWLLCGSCVLRMSSITQQVQSCMSFYLRIAGLYSIWIQQIRTSWQESPHNNSAVSKLTRECRDLLDKMFDVNQDSRITIDGIIRWGPCYNSAVL
jgi:hypothetical protein